VYPLIDVPLIGLLLMGVPLTSVPFMRVSLIGVLLTRHVSHRVCSLIGVPLKVFARTSAIVPASPQMS
jgi:hypothetical protein